MDNKCVICGKDSGKGQTCGPTHRKALHRRSVTTSVTNVTVEECDKPSVTMPKNYGQADCECKHCQQTKARRELGQIVINHGAYKTAQELGEHEVNRVSLPGDVDYEGYLP